MNDENSSQDNDESKAEELKETASNIVLKVIDALKKKYSFQFSVYGWVIAIAALILLMLIFK